MKQNSAKTLNTRSTKAKHDSTRQSNSVQSLDRLGRRGDMEDESAEILLQSFLQEAFLTTTNVSRKRIIVVEGTLHLCRPLEHVTGIGRRWIPWVRLTCESKAISCKLCRKKHLTYRRKRETASVREIVPLKIKRTSRAPHFVWARSASQ